MSRRLAHPDHWSTPQRKTLGRDPRTMRKRFGWNARCSCGWMRFSNEDKRHAEQLHRGHLREVLGLVPPTEVTVAAVAQVGALCATAPEPTAGETILQIVRPAPWQLRRWRQLLGQQAERIAQLEALVVEQYGGLPYDPAFGDDRTCACGHRYERHFDTYDDMRPIGCKYCDCRTWREPGKVPA